MSVPQVPEIVRVYDPSGVELVVVTIREAEPDPPMIVPGVILAVAPAGSPLTPSVTFPVNPNIGTIFMV